MSAPRTSSVRALRQVSRSGRQIRQLHLTGSASSSRLLVTEKPSISAIRAYAAEQQKSENRKFNTSRTMKAPKDSSTIDFAFMPDTVSMNRIDEIRVPLMPTNYSPSRVGAHAPLAEEIIPQTPLISTASGISTFVSAPSPLADTHDHAHSTVDFHAVTESLNSAAQSVAEETKAATSSIGRLWSGLVDDVLGPRKPNVA